MTKGRKSKRIPELEKQYNKSINNIIKEYYLEKQIGIVKISKELKLSIKQIYDILKKTNIETRHEFQPNKIQQQRATEKIKHKFDTCPNYKQNISNGRIKYYEENPEARETSRKQLEELRNINNRRIKVDVEYKKRQLKGIYEFIENNGQLKYRPINKTEKHIDNILQKHFPNIFKFVGDGNANISGLCPDFISVDGSKKIIEVFGDIWHDVELAKKTRLNINVTYSRTEEGRKNIFKKHGYDCLVIWVSDIRKMGEKSLVSILNNFIKK